jgi:hypothetical protein
MDWNHERAADKRRRRRFPGLIAAFALTLGLTLLLHRFVPDLAPGNGGVLALFVLAVAGITAWRYLRRRRQGSTLSRPRNQGTPAPRTDDSK